MKSTAVSTSDRLLIICWYAGFPVRRLLLGLSFTCIRGSAEEIRLSLSDNDEEKLKSSNFVIARRTILIVHGYWGNYRSIWVNQKLVEETEMFCIDETGQKFETKFVSRLTIHSRRETYFSICYSVRITLLEYTGLTQRGLLRLVSYAKILFYKHGPPAMVACYDIIKTAYTHHTCKSNCGTVRLPHQIIFKKHMVTEISKVWHI